MEETDELVVAANVLAEARERMIAADAVIEAAGDVQDPIALARLEQLLDASASLFVVAESLMIALARTQEDLALTAEAVVVLGTKHKKLKKKNKKQKRSG